MLDLSNIMVRQFLYELYFKKHLRAFLLHGKILKKKLKHLITDILKGRYIPAIPRIKVLANYYDKKNYFEKKIMFIGIFKVLNIYFGDAKLFSVALVYEIFNYGPIITLIIIAFYYTSKCKSFAEVRGGLGVTSLRGNRIYKGHKDIAEKAHIAFEKPHNP
jgi:hypothetical protein